MPLVEMVLEESVLLGDERSSSHIILNSVGGGEAVFIDFIEITLIDSFSFLRVENNNFVFKVLVGEPDTDNYLGVKYMVSMTGKTKIKHADWRNN